MHRLVLIAVLCLSAVVAIDFGENDLERREFGESVERELGKGSSSKGGMKKSYESSPDHYKESKSGGGSGSKGSKSGGSGSSKGSKSGGSGSSKGR